MEELIYPLVTSIVSEYGLNPTEAILKYHGGNKVYLQPEGSETEFASLDTDFQNPYCIVGSNRQGRLGL